MSDRPACLAAGLVLLIAGAAQVASASEPAAKPLPAGRGEGQAGAEAPFRYDSKGHRDPFVPLVRDGRLVASSAGTRIEESKPVLYGILWDPSGNSIALINDTEARVGDRIGEYKVKEIQRNAVVLDRGGEPVVLTIVFDTPPGPKSTGTITGGRHP